MMLNVINCNFVVLGFVSATVPTAVKYSNKKYRTQRLWNIAAFVFISLRVDDICNEFTFNVFVKLTMFYLSTGLNFGLKDQQLLAQ